MSVFECIWMYVSVCECILSVTSVFVCIWVYVSVMKVFDFFYCLWILWVYLSVFECIWVYLGVFECMWLYLSVFECMWVLVYFSVLEYIRVYSSVFECMLVMYSRSVLSGSVSTWSSNVWKSILSLWEWAQEWDFHFSSFHCWWQSFSRTCSWNTLKYTHVFECIWVYVSDLF